jgi:thioredoxin 1
MTIIMIMVAGNVVLQCVNDPVGNPDRLIADTSHGSVVALDKNTFYDSIKADGRVAMVEFYSPTCPACMSMEEIVAALADTFNGTAIIAKVNVLTEDLLLDAFGIYCWPTFVFFKNGAEYTRTIGVTTIDTLTAAIRGGFKTGALAGAVSPARAAPAEPAFSVRQEGRLSRF